MASYRVMRRALAALALALGLGLGLAAGAHAATPGSPAPEPAARAGDPAAATDARAWEGRYCTPLGCKPGAPASGGSLAAFAAAAAGALFWSRRGRANRS